MTGHNRGVALALALPRVAAAHHGAGRNTTLGQTQNLTCRSSRMSMNLACRLLWLTSSRTVLSAWFCAPVSASTYSRSATCAVGANSKGHGRGWRAR